MRNPRQVFAAILLAFALCAPVYAGEITGYPVAAPTPTPTPVEPGNQSVPPAHNTDSQASAAPDAFSGTTTVVFDLLYCVLSIY